MKVVSIALNVNYGFSNVGYLSSLARGATLGCGEAFALGHPNHPGETPEPNRLGGFFLYGWQWRATIVK